MPSIGVGVNLFCVLCNFEWTKRTAVSTGLAVCFCVFFFFLAGGKP